MKYNAVTKTKAAFWMFLANVAYIVMFLIFGFAATALEVPCNRDGAYLIFAYLWIVMWIFQPLFATVYNAIGVGFQISAMREGESKIKNILMMVFAVLYEAASIWLFIRFCQGVMSA
jgi:hypothetical protein